MIHEREGGQLGAAVWHAAAQHITWVFAQGVFAQGWSCGLGSLDRAALPSDRRSRCSLIGRATPIKGRSNGPRALRGAGLGAALHLGHRGVRHGRQHGDADERQLVHHEAQHARQHLPRLRPHCPL